MIKKTFFFSARKNL